uniref:calcium-binding protein n=1 Tax=Chitinivorax sp. B TaxID=2502235 RepID=UPI0024B50062
LDGGAGNDTLDGGVGNDTLKGGLGDDRYVFAGNFGTDVVETGSGADVLAFTDLTRAALGFKQAGKDLLVAVNGQAGQSVRVVNHFAGAATALHSIQVKDGVLTAAEIQRAVTTPVPTPTPTPTPTPVPTPTPTPVPTPTPGGNDTLVGTADADVLLGGAGNDDLSGKAGNDTLIGGSGDDTYRFARSEGQDVIDNSGNGHDTLRFSNGVKFNDVASNLGRSGDDLVLKIAGTSDQVTLKRFFQGGEHLLETIAFDDGGQLTAQAIFSAFKLPVPATTSAFDSQKTGTDTAETLTGTAQRDRLVGLNGHDSLQGEAGNDQLDGGNGNDTLRGGAANDLLLGGRGDDTYVFAKGDGQDVIDNLGGGTDVLLFEGIAFNEVSRGLMKSGNDLTLKVANSTDQVTLRDFFLGGDQAVKTIRFASGGELTAAKLFEVFKLTNPDPVGSPVYVDLPNDSRFGTVLAGQAGNQSIIGSTDADMLDGGAGNDTLDGGANNDYLLGGLGNDTYRFNSGFGADTLQENDATVGNRDVIQFGAGLTRDQLTFSKTNNDLVIGIKRTTDQVTVKHWFLGTQHQIEQIKTADNQTILNTQVDALLSTPPAAMVRRADAGTLDRQTARLVEAMASFSPTSAAASSSSLSGDTPQSMLAATPGNWRHHAGDTTTMLRW